MLTVEEIFQKGKKLLEVLYPVSTPEFPEGLFVRMMSGQDRSDFELQLKDNPGEDPGLFRAALVKQTVVNEQGVQFFKDHSLEDVIKLPIAIIEPLVEEALKVNRFSKVDREELEKKLTGDGSSSL
jgi:hypothetical protein